MLHARRNSEFVPAYVHTRMHLFFEPSLAVSMGLITAVETERGQARESFMPHCLGTGQFPREVKVPQSVTCLALIAVAQVMSTQLFSPRQLISTRCSNRFHFITCYTQLLVVVSLAFCVLAQQVATSQLFVFDHQCLPLHRTLLVAI